MDMGFCRYWKFWRGRISRIWSLIAFLNINWCIIIPSLIFYCLVRLCLKTIVFLIWGELRLRFILWMPWRRWLNCTKKSEFIFFLILECTEKGFKNRIYLRFWRFSKNISSLNWKDWCLIYTVLILMKHRFKSKLLCLKKWEIWLNRQVLLPNGNIFELLLVY